MTKELAELLVAMKWRDLNEFAELISSWDSEAADMRDAHYIASCLTDAAEDVMAMERFQVAKSAEKLDAT